MRNCAVVIKLMSPDMHWLLWFWCFKEVVKTSSTLCLYLLTCNMINCIFSIHSHSFTSTEEQQVGFGLLRFYMKQWLQHCCLWCLEVEFNHTTLKAEREAGSKHTAPSYVSLCLFHAISFMLRSLSFQYVMFKTYLAAYVSGFTLNIRLLKQTRNGCLLLGFTLQSHTISLFVRRGFLCLEKISKDNICPTEETHEQTNPT